MSIERIESRASRALAHPDLAWLLDDLPSGYKNNPKAISALLVAAADADPAFASSPAYKAAHAALVPLGEARDLRDRLAAAWHNPRIRAEVGEARLAAAWRDPESAFRELIQRSAAGGLSPALDAALNTLGEYREFARANGQALPQPSEAPIPSDVGKVESELAELRTKSVNGNITKAEDARLNQLYEARVARENTDAAAEIAAHAKALGMRDRPAGEYRSLIEKSVTGKLTAEEDSRLTQLSGARAIEQGLVTQDDLDAETTE